MEMRNGMRDEMLDRWCERIGRAASLLGENLQEPPTLNELESCAAISPFHFHRMWRELTGRTVGETVKHFRIAQAQQALLGSDAPIGHIAMTRMCERLDRTGNTRPDKDQQYNWKRVKGESALEFLICTPCNGFPSFL
jgi:hypothetical protein